MKSYRDLEIYKLSYDLAVEVHKFSLTLPRYEIYEERVAKSENPLKVSHPVLLALLNKGNVLRIYFD